MRWQLLAVTALLLFLATLASAKDEIVDLSHNGSGWNSFGEEADEIKRFQTFCSDATETPN